MNIYCIELTSWKEVDRVWTEGETVFGAIERALRDARVDFEHNFEDAQALDIKVSLHQAGMSMDAFEAANPEFFFT